MKTFNYTVKDELGIHARPAGLLVNETKKFKSQITLEKEGKKVDASRLIAVMSLGVKKDQTVVVTIEGEDEAQALSGIQAFFKENL